MFIDQLIQLKQSIVWEQDLIQVRKVFYSLHLYLKSNAKVDLEWKWTEYIQVVQPIIITGQVLNQKWLLLEVETILDNQDITKLLYSILFQ